MLLQFKTTRLITIYDSVLLQFTIAWSLHFSTTVITIYGSYQTNYNSRQNIPSFVALFFRIKQFLIFLTLECRDVVKDVWCSVRNFKLKKGSSMLLFKHCSTIFADCVIFLITSFEILILLHGLIIKGELYRVKAYNEEADH